MDIFGDFLKLSTIVGINEPSLTVCGEGAGGGALAGLGGGGVARVGVAGAVGGVRCVH